MKTLMNVLICLLPILGIAQNGVIKGTVKDKQSNEAIIGANILIVGSEMGTSTDFGGYYILEGL